MWMMGCSDASDSFNSRKLRPLMPRPATTSNTTANGGATSTHPYLSRINGSELFGRNNHHFGKILYASLAAISEQSKRDYNASPTIVSSSRWNPTPEQIQTLEELYRRGTRTPTSDQIQHITAQLRRYGKIEGKNVFYWFQNHKARERQKRRRRCESIEEDQQQQNTENLDNKEAESSRTSFEVEQHAKNWGFSTNCSTVTEVRGFILSLFSFFILLHSFLSVGANVLKLHCVVVCRVFVLAFRLISISMCFQESASEKAAETSERIQFEEGELQHTIRSSERHTTWPMKQISCSNTTTPTSTTTASAAIATTFMNPRHINTQNFSIFLKPHQLEYEEQHGESHTLQLFPVRQDDFESGANVAKESELRIETVNTNGSPQQFFKFL
ncbi:hypothetical protein IFM89_014911 [Coptis chinensis]|uniref:Homeobox domain-containing protein n=1 Tax=Coptis chinensis TaxID=261450 RepID=A0A835LM77_9MAGN|nr:hypothetical protein IFM89_014911 [Coptis chinensis]